MLTDSIKQDVAEMVLNSREVGVVSRSRQVEIAQEELFDMTGSESLEDIQAIMETVDLEWSNRKSEARLACK